MAPRKGKKMETYEMGAADMIDLKKVVDATKAGGFVYMTVDASANLVQVGLVETNPAMTDETGALATRATPKGLAMTFENTDAASTNPAPAAAVASAPIAKSTYAIDTNIPVPTVKRGGRGRTSSFPFDALEVGASFHVAPTAERPDPAASLGSTVSNANAKYAKETGESETVTVAVYQKDEAGKRVKVDGKLVKVGTTAVIRPKTVQEREFVMRSVDASDPRGVGVRIFRLR